MDSAGREILGNIPAAHQVYFFIITWLSLAVFSAGILVRARLWFQGRTSPFLPTGQITAHTFVEHLRVFIIQTFVQPRLHTSTTGLAHVAIFWGFFVLFVGTNLVFLDHATPLSLLSGFFYLLFSLSLDLFGILMIVGLWIAAHRRFSDRGKVDYVPGYGPGLTLLAFIGVTGFLLEGSRMSLLGSQWFDFSPVGAVFATGFDYIIPDEAEKVSWHRRIWWLHVLLTFSFIAYLPFGRLLHAVTAPMHILAANRKPSGVLSTPYHLEDIESGSLTRAAPRVAADLHWTQLLSFDACTECGRCDDACPSLAVGSPLSPKETVSELRQLLHQGKSFIQNRPLEEIVTSEAAWSCTTCGACTHACPVSIRPMDLLVESRRAILTSNRIEPGIKKTLNNLQETGNPFGFDPQSRLAWAADLPVDIQPTVLDPGIQCELLLWVGCWGSFDERGQKVTRALVTLLARAGVDYAVLGPEERCTGDSARRLGEEGLFQQMVISNIERFNQHGIRKIITACPHCLNSLGTEYREFGADLEVMHHSEFISTLFNEGSLQTDSSKTAETNKRKITFHDPCYLGRHNGIFDAPRQVLSSLPGSSMVEMEASREKSRCCGAGGSNAWFDLGHGRGMNATRYQQAAATRAEVIATGCPFCLSMMEEAASGADETSTITVKDLAELVEERTHPFVVPGDNNR